MVEALKIMNSAVDRALLNMPRISTPKRTPRSYSDSILALEKLIGEWQKERAELDQKIAAAVEEIRRLDEEWLDMEEAV